MNVVPDLGDVQIHVRDRHPGEHRTSCPRCAEIKFRRDDTALAVKVDGDGSKWCCHRCDWHGAIWRCRDCDKWRSTEQPHECICRSCGGPRIIGEPHECRSKVEERQHHERQPRPPRPAAPEPDRRAAGIAATALWRSTLPITADTVAGRYLLARDCALPHPDGDLRWLPDHRHPYSGRYWPCIVALVTDAVTVEPLSLHQTWLDPARPKEKAPVDQPRLTWAKLPIKGGVCRLWPDAEITMGLLVGEGIETVLTAARGFPAAWACLDAGNLETFPVLAGIDCLTIVADHDRIDPRTGKRRGNVAAEACTRRWVAAGVDVWLHNTPGEGQDFNDLARNAS